MKTEFGPRQPEYIEIDIDEFIKKLKKIHEEMKEIKIESVEEKANAVREKIRREGINMATMKEVLKTLDKTGFEAFKAVEINYLVGIIDYIILEVDPAYKQFYQDLKQRLTGIAQIKLKHEHVQLQKEQKKREKRTR